MEEVSVMFVVYKPATMVFVTFAFSGLQILQTRLPFTRSSRVRKLSLNQGMDFDDNCAR